MKKCKCGCDKFVAHQVLYADVLVDSENNFESNWDTLHGRPCNSADKAIYESERPYGPYTCAACGTEYDSLDELEDISETGKLIPVAKCGHTVYGITISYYHNGKEESVGHPSGNPLFVSKESAFEFANKRAEADSDRMMELYNKCGLSFGVSEGDEDFEAGNAVTINCYTMADEYDMTGETSVVRKYRINEINI